MPKMFKSVIKKKTKTLFQLRLYIKNLGAPSPYTAPFPTISTERPPAKTQTHQTEIGLIACDVKCIVNLFSYMSLFLSVMVTI